MLVLLLMVTMLLFCEDEVLAWCDWRLVTSPLALTCLELLVS